MKTEAAQNLEFTHFDSKGNARMVDVSQKDITHRSATAQGTIRVSADVMDAILGRKLKKGDVYTVGQVAGIMGAKKTSDLIPMCHILILTHAAVTFDTDEDAGTITAYCTVQTDAKTGVEMEALTGVSICLLTIYDMCKAIDKRMVIEDIHLVEKSGGKSGNFRFESAAS
jgi:cyclic pyranopterin phosphate synthase